MQFRGLSAPWAAGCHTPCLAGTSEGSQHQHIWARQLSGSTQVLWRLQLVRNWDKTAGSVHSLGLSSAGAETAPLAPLSENHPKHLELHDVLCIRVLSASEQWALSLLPHPVGADVLGGRDGTRVSTDLTCLVQGFQDPKGV